MKIRSLLGALCACLIAMSIAQAESVKPLDSELLLSKQQPKNILTIAQGESVEIDSIAAKKNKPLYGLEGSKRNDTITNNGSLSVFNNIISNVIRDIFGGNDIYAIGIFGDAGDDVIQNNGELETTSSATFFRLASAYATGIDGGKGDDTISNTGSINTVTNATALTGEISLLVRGRRPADTKTASTAIAQSTAITGDVGDDIITNSGSISSFANTSAAGLFGSIEPASSSLFETNNGVTSDASATGIAGGEGNDVISNTGVIQVYANATTLASSESLTILGAAKSVSISTAKSTATAIDGGVGDDSIENRGELNATAVATSVASNVSFSQSGIAQATYEGGTIAEATATGITGGGETSSSSKTKQVLSRKWLRVSYSSDETAIGGDDIITNSGSITANAIATSGALGGAVSIESAALADTSSRAKASATVIDGGAGDDSITNQGELNAIAVATSVASNVAFSPKSDAKASHEGGATAEAIATGVTGDGDVSSKSIDTVLTIDEDALSFEYSRNETAVAGDDTITNSGLITASAIATSGAQGGVISIEGAATADTSSKAKASATIIDGGAGDDSITNQGALNAIAVATSVASNVAFSNTGEAKTSHEGGATAEAIATGITGDGDVSSKSIGTVLTIDEDALSFEYSRNEMAVAGDDTITNSNLITASAIATSGAQGGAISIEGAATADTSSKAKASATAIDGGAGDDSITNQGALNAIAVATSVASNVAFSNTGEAKTSHEGGATTEAIATGITGDGDASSKSNETVLTIDEDALSFEYSRNKTAIAGDDTITNSGLITASAVATSGALGGAVSIEGAATADTSSKAKSSATAIDGGAGDDEISNTGVLIATANSTAVTGNFSVTNGKDKAIVTGGSEAEATAVGIDADGDATNYAVTTAIDVTLNGASFFNEVLIQNNSGDDTVTNDGNINAIATSLAPGLGAAVGLNGAAASMLTSKATSQATAIDLGDGNDSLTSTGQLNAVATSTAVTGNFSVTNGKDKAIVKGGPEAEATAVGIDADGDATNYAVTTAIDVTLNGASFFNEVLIQNDGGDDTVTNDGNINAIATSLAPGLGVAVGVTGAAESMLTSKATSQATAIDLGGGNDSLTSTGQLNAVATSIAAAANIPVSAGKGSAIALSGSETEATAVGIDADGDATNYAVTTAIDVTLDGASFLNEVLIHNDGGDDVVDNQGDISAVASAITEELDVAVAMKGMAFGVTTGTATSQATAIDLGGGNDNLTSTGQLNTVATSIAIAANIPVSAGKGSAIALSGSTAGATAVGIDADGDATNYTVTTAIDVTLDGASFLNEVLIHNDGGDDVVDNQGDINAVATALTPELLIPVAVKGVSFASSAAKARSQAIAIDLGGGDDELTNTGQLNVIADSIAAAASVPVSAGSGAAITLGGPEADATAVGIDADGDATNYTVTTAIDVTLDGASFLNEVLIQNDSGDDVVDNQGDINAVANSITPELDVPVAVKNVSFAMSAAKARSQAIAIDLGGGNDELTNTGQLNVIADSIAAAASIPVTAGTGAAISLGGPEAEATAVGIDADGDSDASNISITTAIDVTQDGASFLNEVLIHNDGGDDVVDNQGDINAIATALTPELDIPVAVKGVSFAMTAAKAKSQAIAIDLGGGNDNLISTGQLNTVATSIAAAASIPVTAGTGAAISLGGPEAEATAVGIDADGDSDASNISITTAIDATQDGASFFNEVLIHNDSGDDVVDNQGDIIAVATALTAELDIPVTMAGVTVGVTAAKARSQAIAIDLGGGDDDLTNTGQLNAIADSIAAAASIPVSAGTGAAISLGGPEADAMAVGIDADGDSDASNISITTAIDATQDGASFFNEVLIHNDSGDDVVDNQGDINAIATALTAELDIPVTMAGVTVGVTAAKARSQAIAIDLGGGDDDLTNTGQLNAIADSIAAAASIPVSAGTGAAISLGGPEADAMAVGIDADGDSDASNISITTAIDATQDGASFFNEVLIHNDGGDDVVDNQGDINAIATALTAELDIPVTMAGVTVGVTAAKARSQAIAIDLGGGNDDLNNTGQLNVLADSIAVAANIPVSAGTGVAISLGGPEADATAVGIDADGDSGASNISITTAIDATNDGVSFFNEVLIQNDSGDDTVTNDGDINTVANSIAPELDVPVTMAGVTVGVTAAKARSQAIAIDLGGGNDDLNNTGQLNVLADSIAAAANIPVSAGTGVAISLGGPEADATAVGIDADGDSDARNISITTAIDATNDGASFFNEVLIQNDSGDDVVDNQGNINAVANSIAPELDVPVTMAGVTIGVSAAKARSQAIAIDLGGGDDELTNIGQLNAIADSIAVAANIPVAAGTGAAIALGGPEAEATAVGIDADGDASNISITTTIDATQDGASFFNEVLIQNDSGDDAVTNDGDINAVATSIAPELDIPVAVTGLAVGVSAAKAVAKATAIDLGGGDDDLISNGKLTAVATSTAVAANVAVTTAGVAITVGGLESKSTAVGIDADGDSDASNISITTAIDATQDDVSFFNEVLIQNDSGNDTITNNGDIVAVATAVAPALGVAVAVGGVSAAISTAEATANATAISMGDGDDDIYNSGKLNAVAISNADSINVSVAPAGVALAANAVWDGGTNAVATAVGIDADGTGVKATNVTRLGSIDGGFELSNINTVSGANGNDKVTNDGDIRVDAIAAVPSVAISFTGAGLAATIATASSKAETTAIATGDGNDEIVNHGQLESFATSNADSINVAVTPAGVALAADAVWDGGTTAEANAFGISTDGGAVNDTNETTITSGADGISITHSRNVAYASGDDLVINDGDINTVATAVAPSIGVSVAVAGVAGVITTATSDANATAVDTGGGDDEVYNSGDLSAIAVSNADALSVAVAPAGLAAAANAVWDGGVSATSSATGINTDGIKQQNTLFGLSVTDGEPEIIYEDTVELASGDDIIINDGDIDLLALSISPSVSVGVSVWGVGVAVSTAEAESDATGINSGGGEDLIENHGDITTVSNANAAAVNVAVSVGGVALAADAVWDSGTTAEAFTHGINAGDGDDVIENFGVLDTTAVAVAPSISVPVGIFGVAVALSDATANAYSTGINAGGGSDEINNKGNIFSTSVANADAIGVSVNIFGVAVSGNAVWDGGVTAGTSALGINAGSGDDDITNEANIDANSTAVAVSGNIPFTLGGVAAAVSTSTAQADATAIEGGAGQDEIYNDGALSANADSTAVTVAGSIGVFGVAVASDSVWDGGTHSSANAYGINGGDDEDTLTNVSTIEAHSIARSNSDQISVTLIGVTGSIATSTSTTESHAIAGGDGNDNINNSGEITSIADARATSVAVSISGVGAAVAADAVWDGGTGATANAFGISGGNGNDEIWNWGTINAGLENDQVSADTDSVSVAGTFSVGVTAALASSTATSNATAIDGGSGDDTIFHLGEANVYSSADAGGVSVSVVPIFGAAIANSFVDDATRADATGNGITGGDGTDTIMTSDDSIVNVNAVAKTKATNVALVVSGLSNADASTRATSHADGIKGDSGSDVIDHSGDLTVTANSQSVARSIGFTGLVATVTDTSSGADAYASGISGGEGEDQIINRNNVSADASANAYGQSIGINVAGASLSDASTTSDVGVAGLDGGLGDDTLINLGSVTSTGNASATGFSLALNALVAGISNASTNANVNVVGLDGGFGNDSLINDGSITVEGASTTNAKSTSINGVGYSSANADAISTARSVGISGGDDQDILTNTNVGDIEVTANATANSNGVSINLLGVSGAEVTTSPTATALGMEGGVGDDEINNGGTLAVNSTADTVATGTSFTIGGANVNRISTTTTSNATGLDGGDGVDEIENSGSLDVNAASDMQSSGSSWALVGKSANEGSGSLDVTTHASGLSGGNDSDSLKNTGAITVNGDSSLAVTGDSDAIIGGANADTTVNSETFATGMDGGEGDDVIDNYSAIDVTATASMTSDQVAFAFIGGSSANATLISEADAKGLTGGAGVDQIKNAGTVTVSAISTVTATGGAVSTIGIGGTSAGATVNADAITTGINSGSGDDNVVNLGNLFVNAEASPTVITNADAGGLFADSVTRSVSSSTKISYGVDLVDGNNSLLNAGALNVTTLGNVRSTANSETALLGVDLDAKAVAIATLSATEAIGVLALDGNNIIENTGSMMISSASQAFAIASADGDGLVDSEGSSQALARAYNSRAYGVQVGDGTNTIINRDTITISAQPRVHAFSYSDATGIDLLAQPDSISKAAVFANDTFAVGMSAGDGDNWIFNEDSLTVTAAPRADKANAFADFGADFLGIDAFATATATASDAQAFGISVGHGSNFISNSGNLKVVSNPVAYATATAWGIGYDGDAEARATAKANNALAIGIRAGDGNNTVINDGEIDVSATPGAQATAVAIAGSGASEAGTQVKERVCDGWSWLPFNGWLCREFVDIIVDVVDVVVVEGQEVKVEEATTENARAIGIQTGSGNDVITNNGSIITHISSIEYTGAGIGITSGAGNDTVLLGDGSLVTGSIDLGSDDDILQLQGTPVVNGEIISGSGMDSLVFDGEGSFTNPLNGFMQATKQGAGIYRIPTLQTMQQLDMQRGTLQIDSGYTMLSDSRFLTTVYTDGTNGALAVQGLLTLNGELIVNKENNPYVVGDTYYDVVVSNENLKDNFVDNTLPEATPLLGFKVNQLQNSVQVVATANPIESVANSTSEIVITKVLDSMAQSASGDINNIVAEFQELSATGYDRAFASLNPVSYDSSRVMKNIVRRFNYGAQNRLANIRTAKNNLYDNKHNDFLPGSEPVFFSAKSIDTEVTAPLKMNDQLTPAPRQPQQNVWLVAFGDNNAKAENHSLNNFDTSSNGVSMGMDYNISPRFNAGVSYGYVNSGVTQADGLSASDISSDLLSFYSSYMIGDDTYFESLLTVGNNNYNNIRFIAIGDYQKNAVSSHNSSIFSTGFTLGRAFHMGDLKMEFNGSLQYLSLNEAAFDEHGAGGINLHVKKQQIEDVTGELEWRAGYDVETKNGKLAMQFNVGWLYDIVQDDRSLTVNFSDMPDSSFTLPGNAIDRDGIRVGSAINFIGKNDFSLTARVSTEHRSNYQDTTAMLQALLRF